MFHSLTCKAHKNTMTMRWAATFKTKTVYSIQLESNKICNGENQSSVNAWLSLKLGIAKRNSEERGLSIFQLGGGILAKRRQLWSFKFYNVCMVSQKQILILPKLSSFRKKKGKSDSSAKPRITIIIKALNRARFINLGLPKTTGRNYLSNVPLACNNNNCSASSLHHYEIK